MFISYIKNLDTEASACVRQHTEEENEGWRSATAASKCYIFKILAERLRTTLVSVISIFSSVKLLNSIKYVYFLFFLPQRKSVKYLVFN